MSLKRKIVNALLYVADRLGEPSTWRGIISIVGALGAVIAPTTADAISTVAAAMFAHGAVGSATRG